ERRYFFFSSRRRHTRFSRDWSSDVCSSDLFKLEWGPSSNMLTVQGDYYLGDLGLITGGNSDTRGGNFLVRWDKQLSDRSSIRLRLYYDNTWLDQAVPPTFTEDGSFELASAGRLKDNLNTYDLDFQHTLDAGRRHQFVWGLGFR